MGFNRPLRLRHSPLYDPGTHGFAWVRRFLDSLLALGCLAIFAIAAAAFVMWATH